MRNKLVVLLSRFVGTMWNVVRHKVRASQVKVGQDQVTNVRVLAPDTNGNTRKCKCRVVIGRHLLLALFLLVRTHRRMLLQ